MPLYEYKVVPAPEQGKKGKGIKGPKERFAHALESVMNPLGAEGWEYVRTDTLPFEERQGLTGKTTTFQNLLVFRRALSDPGGRDTVTDDQVVGLLAAPQPAPAPETSRNAQSAAAGAVAALAAYRTGRKSGDLAAE